jgi:hypothetical protein
VQQRDLSATKTEAIIRNVDQHDWTARKPAS